MASTSSFLVPSSHALSVPHHTETVSRRPCTQIITDHNYLHPLKLNTRRENVQPVLTYTNFKYAMPIGRLAHSPLDNHSTPQNADTPAVREERYPMEALPNELLFSSPFDDHKIYHSNPPVKVLFRGGRDTCGGRVEDFPYSPSIEPQTDKRILGFNALQPLDKRAHENAIFEEHCHDPSERKAHFNMRLEASPLRQGKATIYEQNKYNTDTDAHDLTTETGNTRTGHNEFVRSESRGPQTKTTNRGNAIIFGLKSTVPDKKEMRARRNRESARRSRMKSKQRFHSLEATLFLMRKENRGLRVLVQKLLSKCVENSPYTRIRFDLLLAERF